MQSPYTVTIDVDGQTASTITINSGGTLINTGSDNLLVNGNWTLTSGGTFTPNSGTVTFNGGSQAIAGTGATTFNNLNTSGAASVTTGANITLNGNLSIADGTAFTAAGYALTVTGATTVGGGTSGNLTISSATGAKLFTGLVTINAGGTWNNSGSSAVEFRGGITSTPAFTGGSGIQSFTTNSQALTGTFSIPSVTVTSPAVLTNNNTLTIATALTGTGGLTQASSATLNIGGTSGIITLTATASGNTVNYSGSGQTVHNNNYYHLTLSGSGTDVLQTGTTAITGNLILSGSVSTITVAGLAISGNLAIGDGTTFTAAGFALTVTGTTTVGDGASGNLTISSATGAKLFTGLVTIAANGTWNNSGNSAVEFRGGIMSTPAFNAGSGIQSFTTSSAQTLTGTFTIPNVTITSPTVLTNSNSLTVSTALTGTGGLTQAIDATLILGGTSTLSALTATNSGNFVNYNGASQTLNANNTSYYNLTLSGSLAKTFPTGTTTVNNILSIEGTATTAFTGTLSYGGSATLQYKGSAIQTTGSELPATFAGTGGVIINNSNGVNLGGSSIISSGALTLTSGKLSLSGFNLTLNTSYPVGGSPGASNYIVATSGQVIIISMPSSPYSFPIGGSSYSPCTFTLNSGSITSLSVNLTEGKETNIPVSASNYINRFWTFTPAGASSPNYDATFTYIQADVQGTNEGNILAAKYSPSTWTLFGVTDVTNNILTFSGATSFSDYTGYGATAALPSAFAKSHLLWSDHRCFRQSQWGNRSLYLFMEHRSDYFFYLSYAFGKYNIYCRCYRSRREYKYRIGHCNNKHRLPGCSSFTTTGANNRRYHHR